MDPPPCPQCPEPLRTCSGTSPVLRAPAPSFQRCRASICCPSGWVRCWLRLQARLGAKQRSGQPGQCGCRLPGSPAASEPQPSTVSAPGPWWHAVSRAVCVLKDLRALPGNARCQTNGEMTAQPHGLRRSGTRLSHAWEMDMPFCFLATPHATGAPRGQML